ncbi:MAG: hypothetical protein Q4G42_05100 [Neisseria sp.]|nr:hypothetical protein [Neisseria sp.]
MNKLPADLTQPCPTLPELTDGQAATVLRWSLQVVGQYNDCAARHRALARAVNTD